MADENTAKPGDPPKEPGSEPLSPDEAGSTPSIEGPGAEDTPAEAEVPAAGGAQMPATSAAMTPGQRLAAKKALKATQKREFKEELKREEEEKRLKELEEADRLLGRGPIEPALPQNVERAAGKFTRFLQENKLRILAGVVAAAVAAGIGFGLQEFTESGSAEQAAELARALEILDAPIDADDADGKTDDGKPVFKSASERASKAAAAFADVVKSDSDSAAAAWAKLGQGAAQLRLGKPEEARATFRSVENAPEERPVRTGRAIEGAAIALEAQGKLDEALQAYQQLQSLAGEKALAEYHIARLRLAKGDREGATTLFKQLYDQLSAPNDDRPPSGYLRGEVEQRLAELDSSLVDQGSATQPPQQFSDEQLQRLLQQLQSQGKGGTAPGAGGE